MKLSKSTGFRGEHEWIEEWKNHTMNFPNHSGPPAETLRRFETTAPKCALCWDTGFCPDCLGTHPQYCIAPDCGGYCDCDAGANRRSAYDRSLSEYGLA